MSGTHPSDEVLQQYVWQPAACTAQEIGHIESCPECREAVATYGMLGEAFKEQPAPAFDFDLAAAVIARLKDAERTRQQGLVARPGQQAGRKREERPALMVLLIALIAGVPAWLFRKSAYFVFTDMPSAFYWVLLASGGIVVGLFLLRLHKKYHDVINLLNK